MMELVDQAAAGEEHGDGDEEGAARLEQARAKLRGMWELPSVAHFAKVFSQPRRLRKFTPDVSVHSLTPGRLCTMGLARCAHAGAGADRKPPCRRIWRRPCSSPAAACCSRSCTTACSR